MTHDNPQHSKPCVSQPITQIQVVIFEMTFQLSICVICVILWTNYSAICLEAESDTRQAKWTNDQLFEIDINDIPFVYWSCSRRRNISLWTEDSLKIYSKS